MDTPIRIIIADGHHAELEGIKSELRSESSFIIAGAVENGKDLLAVLAKQKPDVILISNELPRRDETIKNIREKYPEVKILMMVPAYSEKANGRAKNADGIVLKDGGKKEFVKAIYSVWEDGEYFPAEFRELIFRTERSRETHEELTKRELEVLLCIADTMKNKEIAMHLGLAENTIKVYRKNLYSKLSVNNVMGLLKVARERGYLK